MVNVHGGRDWSAATRDSSLKFSRLSVTFLHGRGGPYKALGGHHYWSGATRVRDQSQPCVWIWEIFKANFSHPSANQSPDTSQSYADP